jgi:hypothetical protein
MRSLHDALMAEIDALGPYETAPKKGYLSLRRRRQFAMIQPTTTGRIDVGLILPAGTACTDRLESAAGFNALFSHRVRLSGPAEIDGELHGWLAAAYLAAG